MQLGFETIKVFSRLTTQICKLIDEMMIVLLSKKFCGKLVSYANSSRSPHCLVYLIMKVYFRFQGPCLLDAIDSLQPPQRDYSKPILMPICDLVKLPSQGQVSVCGKLETGALQTGDKVLNYPLTQERSFSFILTLRHLNSSSIISRTSPLLYTCF